MKRLWIVVIGILVFGALDTAGVMSSGTSGAGTQKPVLGAALKNPTERLANPSQGLIQDAFNLIEGATSSKPAAPAPEPSQSPVVQPSPTGPFVSSFLSGPFHAAGNRIVDNNGQPVVFRGLVRDGTERPRSWGRIWPTDTEIGHIKEWGANFVRVPLDEAQWLNTCSFSPSNDPKYPGLLDAEVASITSRGMFALLELNFNPISNCGRTGPQAMADAAHSMTFWQQVAARYKGNPLVGFDLYNEPGAMSDAQWLNGGLVVSQWGAFIAAGMQKLYNAVRSTGATNLVFIAGKEASTPAAAQVSGVNIVLSVHIYYYDPNKVLDRWQSLGQTHPVMITELGFPNYGQEGSDYANVISACEQRGWGWSAFAFDGAVNGPFDLIADTTTYQPAPAGVPVKNGFAANG